MQLHYWSHYSQEQQQQLLARPMLQTDEILKKTVADIIAQVRNGGDETLHTFNQRFDNSTTTYLAVSAERLAIAQRSIKDPLKRAVEVAAKNIQHFHRVQRTAPIALETQPGVYCQQLTRPIQTVGLYIPGGTAPLVSSVLMLAIPAKLAGCTRVVLCSPPPIADEILYAAHYCGIQEVYQVGGAQAIAAMALGTTSIPRVDKIFGPGNAYVTEAKRQVSQLVNGAASDLPAGPSEVLVIADHTANAAFIAADLLSQAEHGIDSQVLLVTPDENLAQQVAIQIEQQLVTLPRSTITRQALEHSRLIVTQNLTECFLISNQYAPEHLMVQTNDAEQWVEHIQHAGSVFLGHWSPESAGDYASGTNHVLPTYGYCRQYSSLGLADFYKRMTVQQLTPQGLLELAPTIEALALSESLTAHQRAVSLRVATLLKESNCHD